MIISELNMSSTSGESFVDNFGSLWLADFVGSFLTAGGDALYFFHYIPEPLDHGCGSSMSTFGMFVMNKDYQIQQPTSQYFASQLINLEWVQPGSGTHQVFPASSDVADTTGHNLVTAYAVRRPDGQWALMIVNKDQENSHSVQLGFHDAGANRDSAFTGPVDRITFGSEQYRWNAVPNGGSANPDSPPSRSQLTADPLTTFTLPRASVTILRGHIAAIKGR